MPTGIALNITVCYVRSSVQRETPISASERNVFSICWKFGHMTFCVELFPGRRMCLGDSLVKMEMSLFVTTLLQRFDFRMVDANSPPSTEGIEGLTRSPRKYELIVSRV